jgi:hypothetical protein
MQSAQMPRGRWPSSDRAAGGDDSTSHVLLPVGNVDDGVRTIVDRTKLCPWGGADMGRRIDTASGTRL